MSKKAFTEAAEEIDEIGADWGPLLKSLGTVLTEAWQEQNGEYLSKEERSKRKTPLAQVDQSDIQIRMGDTMLTLVPEEAGKSMVSIPVGFSDKATPATIPREWLAGTFLDGLISIFEGNTEVVWQYVQRINAAIDAAAEVDDNGRMKINTKKLADHKYPVDVAEMLESMKRSYISRSNGSAKVKASFTITKLQQVNPDPKPEPQPSLPLLKWRSRSWRNPTPSMNHPAMRGSSRQSQPLLCLPLMLHPRKRRTPYMTTLRPPLLRKRILTTSRRTPPIGSSTI